MAKYYGVVRSEEYLAHYGVKGMRWGVRKAIEKGNSRSLARHYKRASKKLAKLNARADRNALINKASNLDAISKKARNIGRIGLGVATLGTGASIGMKHRLNRQNAINTNAVDSLKKQYTDSVVGAATARKYIDANKSLGLNTLQKNFEADIDYYHKTAQKISNYDLPSAKHKLQSTNTLNGKLRDASRAVQAGGAGVGLIGYGVSAGTKLRSNMLKRKANNRSKMADARRDAQNFKQEMDLAFAGTKYGKKRRK